MMELFLGCLSSEISIFFKGFNTPYNYWVVEVDGSYCEIKSTK